MGSQQELLCLRWEEFGSHFSSSFKDLRSQDGGDSFFDVSLAVSDQDHTIQAHKVILSTCSPFFRSVLAKQAAASGPLAGLLHPVIYLRGITARDLRNILDFMYNGEVNVAQQDLDAFLAVAEDLKIKGLTQLDDARPSKRPAEALPGAPSQAKKRTPLHQRGHLQHLPVPPRVESDVREMVPIKTEPSTSQLQAVAPPPSEVVIDGEAEDGDAGYDRGGGKGGDFGDGFDYGGGGDEAGDISYSDGQMMGAGSAEGVTGKGNETDLSFNGRSLHGGGLLEVESVSFYVRES